jgi:hypothetical protein
MPDFRFVAGATSIDGFSRRLDGYVPTFGDQLTEVTGPLLPPAAQRARGEALKPDLPDYLMNDVAKP